MMIFLRILIILTALFVGLVAGTAIGGRFFVPAGSGLAGPVIALGYGVVGALILGAIAVALAWYMKRRGLVVAGVVCGVLIVLFLGLTGWRLAKDGQARAEAEKAFIGLDHYKVSLEQRGTVDAVLARKTAIDTRERQWLVVLPDGRTCHGQFDAATQKDLGNKLGRFARQAGRDESGCKPEAGSGHWRLGWVYDDADAGRLSGHMDVAPDCGAPGDLEALMRTVRAFPSASGSSGARCE